HDNNTPELRRQAKEVHGDRPQHRVERREIPHRSNMLRGLQSVGRLKVWLLQEQTAHLREEEHNDEEDKEEHTHAQQVVNGVVRVERDTVFRNTVFILVLLDVDTVRVV